MAERWPRIRALVEAEETALLAAELAALDRDGRAEITGELPGYWRGLAEHERWARAGGVLVVGAVCAESAAAAATWIRRRDLRDADAPPGLLLAAAEGRDRDWQAEAGRRLAARLDQAAALRGEENGPWRVAAGLLARGGAPPPGDAPFVAGWVSACAEPGVDGPWFPELVPRLFAVDDLGPALERRGDGWLRAVAAHPDRQALLDALVGRLLRGGRPADLRWFVRLHDALAPTAAESLPRLRDYVRMLPSAPPAVADLAFDHLKLIDAATPLPPPLFAEAAENLLFRPEKRLVKAALTWLARTAAKRPADTRAAARTALTHPDPLLRTQAAKLASARRATTPEQPPCPVPPQPMPLRPPPAAELPEAIRSGGELIEAVAAYLRCREPGWAEGERVLAGLVTLGPAHVEELGELVRAVSPHVLDGDLEYTRGSRAVLRALLDPGAARSWTRISLTPEVRYLGRKIGRPVPELVVSGRFDEAAERIGRVPLLLATPTEPTGHVAADVLVDRMRFLEERAAEPGPYDLDQALLRLPLDAAACAGSAALGSPAGRRLHAQLSGAEWDAGSATAKALADPAEGEGFRGSTAWWPAVLPSRPDLIAAHLLAGADREHASFAPAVAALALCGGPAGPATATALALALSGRRPEDRAAGLDALLTHAALGTLPAAPLGEALGLPAIKLNRAAAGLGEAVRAGADLWPVFRAALPPLLPVTGERPRAGLADLVAAAADNAEAFPVTDTIPWLAGVAARGGRGRLAYEVARLTRLVVSH